MSSGKLNFKVHLEPSKSREPFDIKKSRDDGVFRGL